MEQGATTRPPAVGIRWWPAAIVALAAVAALCWIWLPEREGQDRAVLSYTLAFPTLLLLAIWLLFFARLARRRRRVGVAIVLATIVVGAATTRIRGVTGDLVPILEWRWASRVPPALKLEPLPDQTAPAADAAVPPSSAPMPDLPSASRAGFAAAAPVRITGEYPQFLGPTRDGAIVGVRLSGDWSAHPPRLVWRRPIGAGWSGFVVADGLAITQEQRRGREMVVAYNVSDGSPIWSHGDDARYQNTVAGEGPRATPTISRGRVFTLGATGILNCLDLKTGRLIWRRDIAADNDSPQPEWGRSSSPLIVDDLVVVSAGGAAERSLAAYHRDSGEPAWTAGDDAASYSSPVVATLAGVRQIVVLNQSTVVGHDPQTGRVLWTHAWPRTAPSVAVPLILPEGRLLLSAGYGVGSRLLEISRDGDALHQAMVWDSPRFKAKFTNPVFHDGFVYGLDDGVLACLDPVDGQRCWKGGRYGHGQTLLVGNHILVQTEDGGIVLVEASPAAHRELARFQVFDHKTWNPPALAGRYLLVRTDTEAACYELPGAP